jgi:hypothetical protein
VLEELEVPEMKRCVLLRMLEAVEGGVCLPEVSLGCMELWRIDVSVATWRHRVHRAVGGTL